MQRHLLSEHRKLKVRIFSTFFYTKLQAGGHAGVSTWTCNFDVFAQKFVVIPVHLHFHWLVIIVMDPALILSGNPNDKYVMWLF
jgi:Ulp1 family protease